MEVITGFNHSKEMPDKKVILDVAKCFAEGEEGYVEADGSLRLPGGVILNVDGQCVTVGLCAEGECEFVRRFGARRRGEWRVGLGILTGLAHSVSSHSRGNAKSNAIGEPAVPRGRKTSAGLRALAPRLAGF